MTRGWPDAVEIATRESVVTPTQRPGPTLSTLTALPQAVACPTAVALVPTQAKPASVAMSAPSSPTAMSRAFAPSPMALTPASEYGMAMG